MSSPLMTASNVKNTYLLGISQLDVVYVWRIDVPQEGATQVDHHELQINGLRPKLWTSSVLGRRGFDSNDRLVPRISYITERDSTMDNGSLHKFFLRTPLYPTVPE